MEPQTSNDLQQEHGSPLQFNQQSIQGLQQDSRPTQAQIKVCIPKNYQQEPIISRLVSHHGLTVNITAALLGANARNDGWFDLELRGTVPQIQSALVYFNELDIETWHGSSPEEDDW